MKKVLLTSLLMIFMVSLCAELMPVKTDRLTPDYSMKVIPQRSVSRDVPEWEWSVAPQALLTNYADYFQCYNQTPIALQSEENGGGIYIMYRVKDQAGNSEISYTYINNMGTVQASQGIGSVGYYADAVVHQETGDVFGTWHVALDDGTDTYDCIVIYDLYHIIMGHGLWKDPVITVLDSDAQNNLDPTANDEFIWPQLAIGPSPVTGMQRIYCVASNHIDADGSQANPSENVMIMYADFNEGDLSNQSDLDWSYNTIPALDSWNAEDPNWYRPFKSFCVIDNQLIFMGYRIPGDSLPDDPDELFCIINDNYGEGDNWTEYYSPCDFPEENPQFTYFPTGVDWYLFSDRAQIEDPNATPSNPWPVEQNMIHTGHFNLVPTHNNTAVTWAGAMGPTFDSGDGPGYYWVTGYMIYPKTFTFDLNTHEFNITDVYPTGDFPNDGILMEPWDLNEDDVLDEVDPDSGFPEWEEDWPIFHYDADNAFHYNEYYLTTNDDNGWMAYVWVDGLYANAANEGYTGYEDWVAKPELAVAVTNDWGASWSDPIFMNANQNSDTYVEEFEGMIPCFAYPGDRIEDDGDGYGIVHLFFLDDNDYGSFHSQQHGLNNGSTFEYAAMRIYFGEGGGDTDDNNLVAAPMQIKNYPNPFNPTTTIQFEIQTAGHVNVDIYNVRGQKIRTLVDGDFDADTHSVIWNGTNDSGSEVPSGVYFYKTKFGKYTTSKKMILMK